MSQPGKKIMETRTASCMLIAIAVGWFTLSPAARAVDPPPDGGYPNFNTAEGEDALFSLDIRTGFSNTAIGFDALFSNTTGGLNTANGAQALFSNTTGVSNTANGAFALVSNASGSSNTADGFQALYNNTTGSHNTANGALALNDNTTGGFNTAIGAFALFSNTGSGSSNTASGFDALFNNTTGTFNAAHGANALQANTIGGGNTANGGFALASNTTGLNNTAAGFDALFNNTTGSSNIAVGNSAGSTLTTGKNNIDIGNLGKADESGKIRIGNKAHKNAFIAGISGVTVATGVGVIIDSDGHLGTLTSSARFKDEIKPMDKASEAILALQPVSFRYKHELDPDGIPQFGLVAEQVEKVNPDLVARDDEGKPYTVRYEAVNAMLLNEFLKAHRKVEKLEATTTKERKERQSALAQQQKEIRALTATLKEQAAQIQKVSDHLELSKAAPRMVVNNHKRDRSIFKPARNKQTRRADVTTTRRKETI
jgi:hypothetical protein